MKVDIKTAQFALSELAKNTEAAAALICEIEQTSDAIEIAKRMTYVNYSDGKEGIEYIERPEKIEPMKTAIIAELRKERKRHEKALRMLFDELNIII